MGQVCTPLSQKETPSNTLCKRQLGGKLQEGSHHLHSLQSSATAMGQSRDGLTVLDQGLEWRQHPGLIPSLHPHPQHHPHPKSQLHVQPPFPPSTASSTPIFIPASFILIPILKPNHILIRSLHPHPRHHPHLHSHRPDPKASSFLPGSLLSTIINRMVKYFIICSNYPQIIKCWQPETRLPRRENRHRSRGLVGTCCRTQCWHPSPPPEPFPQHQSTGETPKKICLFSFPPGRGSTAAEPPAWPLIKAASGRCSINSHHIQLHQTGQRRVPACRGRGAWDAAGMGTPEDTLTPLLGSGGQRRASKKQKSL